MTLVTDAQHGFTFDDEKTFLDVRVAVVSGRDATGLDFRQVDTELRRSGRLGKTPALPETFVRAGIGVAGVVPGQIVDVNNGNRCSRPTGLADQSPTCSLEHLKHVSIARSIHDWGTDDHHLCDAPLLSDPTAAGSAGLLNIHNNQWDQDAISELGIPLNILPEVQTVRERVGTISGEIAHATGLPKGIPVFVAIGDNQASFLGSVADRHTQLSINVGTGGQVSAYSNQIGHHESLEVRPFPYGGFLLANVGACGGRSFAALENFFQAVARDIFEIEPDDSAYQRMKQLAAQTVAAPTGLKCSPIFTGTRQDPSQRASWTGLTPDNFTPALLTRSLLEGMATTFNEGFAAILSCGVTGISEIVGAGNGIRENSVLQDCIESQFNMQVRKPLQNEEATLGAAITAAIGCGLLNDLSDSSRWIQYEE